LNNAIRRHTNGVDRISSFCTGLPAMLFRNGLSGRPGALRVMMSGESLSGQIRVQHIHGHESTNMGD